MSASWTNVEIPGWETYGELKRRPWRWCSDAAFLVGDVGCCFTCHYDQDEFGYPICGIEFDGMEFEVCCKIMGAFKKMRGEK